MSGKYPTTVPELEERIELHRDHLLDLVDNLPDQERDTIRDAAGWSAKDHVAHLNMWERSMHYLSTGRTRHDGLGVAEATYLAHDVDQINDEIYRLHRDRPWNDVRAEFDAVHDDLIQTLRDTGWDNLQLPYGHYAPNEPGDDSGEPVIYWVAGNTFFHYDMHREWIETLLGRQRRAKDS